MTDEKNESNLMSARQVLFIFASIVVLLAGIKTAGSIVILILLAAFFAVILHPVAAKLQQLKVPRGIAITFIVLVIISVFMAIMTMLASSLNDFIRAYPEYAQILMSKLNQLEVQAAKFDIHFSAEEVMKIFDPSSLFTFATGLLSHLSGAMSRILLVTMLCVFMLFEVRLIPIKLKKVLTEPDVSMKHFQRAVNAVSKYLLIKTFVSMVTGIIIWIFLTYMDVRFAFLWGVLAFALNFIPNVGSILAAIFPIIQALLLGGFYDAIIIAIGYLIVNIIMGNIIDTRLMGKGLGLSTLTVFMSLIFWGWLLGPVGMFLSVPLTIIIKIMLENNHHGKKIAILMGDGKSI
ncbi:AI-2E family transporter [Thorsellia anophelis]|uniref:AI-2 transport protein TqsA n=1 Tax=Thorsellia anophelis DSM 18579 TaxID=1123402 RepID=A0A1H9ZB41_9GAMM|nr:AI-2E family transporter [Thorsellia anophelis]SES78769.1 AI-2 transport protein TqsA [Thorsellia anophelis DSM 18579]